MYTGLTELSAYLKENIRLSNPEQVWYSHYMGISLYFLIVTSLQTAKHGKMASSTEWLDSADFLQFICLISRGEFFKFQNIYGTLLKVLILNN